MAPKKKNADRMSDESIEKIESFKAQAKVREMELELERCRLEAEIAKDKREIERCRLEAEIAKDRKEVELKEKQLEREHELKITKDRKEMELKEKQLEREHELKIKELEIQGIRLRSEERKPCSDNFGFRGERV